MKILSKEKSKSIAKEEINTTTIDNGINNIFCVYCNNLITNIDFQVQVNGSHKHIFANPHGIVFEIGCFKEAVGCLPFQEASQEFSWFSGYSWKIAACSNCLNHNGWLFISNSNSFFGLILEKIYYN